MGLKGKPLSLGLSLRFIHRWQCLVVVIVLVTLPARAQQTAETDAVSQPTAQAPVALADVLTESESASASIRDIRSDLTADRSAALIAERLTPLTREIDTRMRETRKVLAQHPSVEIHVERRLAFIDRRHAKAGQHEFFCASGGGADHIHR